MASISGAKRSCLSIFAALAFAAPAAHGQVLEIGASGAVIVHGGPEVTRIGGSTPIARPIARRAPRARHGAVAPSPGADIGHLALAAAAADLSPDLIEAVAWRESRLRHGAISPKGAIGEMQLMPNTARQLGVDPFDRAQNFRGGAAYLQGLLRQYDGDVVRALAAYNAGPGAVARYKGVPPFRETRGYIADILDHMSQRAVGAAQSSKR